MYRVIVLYEQEPDAAAYAEHAELCRQVPGSVFRHGKVFGTAFGEQRFQHYAEFEFPDLDSFKQVAGSAEFGAAGKDAAGMGIPFTVHFAEIE